MIVSLDTQAEAVLSVRRPCIYYQLFVVLFEVNDFPCDCVTGYTGKGCSIREKNYICY